MSRRRQANFFNKSSRSKTDNSQQQKSLKKKKNEGNSQFIKSKFDLNYEPKFRPIKVNKSSYASKKEIKKIKVEDLNQLAIKTQEQIKEGKKIIIDWSQQHNFRTTRFPSLDDRFTQSKRAITQEIYINNLDTPKNARYIQYLNKLEKDNNYKEIVAKGEHLRTLISSSILQKRRLRTKISMKLKNYSSQLTSTPKDLDKSQNLSQSGVSRNSDPHFNYAIIQEVEEKNRQFFMKNNQKILKAIDYQKNLQNDFGQKKIKSKNKVDQIHDRIICKSKLALLKSQLIRKFKEAKEGFLEDYQVSQQRTQPII